ncbi:MAG: response regulator [Clostridia bacterium]|nr:response regulator [Clostridia bacterium]
MKIIAVDDERLALENLVSAIKKYDKSAEINSFRDPKAALKFVKENPCDVAFLDVQMFGMTGVELAAKIKAAVPGINIIFTTGYSEYMKDAFEMHASGYLLKPITVEKVRKELKNLRSPLAEKKPRVKFQCFGNFEAFIDGEILKFKYLKTKELLAYLVDRRGAGCSSGEIMSILWEDEDHDSYLRNIRKDLMDVFGEKNCAEVIVNDWGKLSIRTDLVECDYYNYLKDRKSENYQGEYMVQYSWAEPTNAYLFGLK